MECPCEPRTNQGTDQPEGRLVARGATQTFVNPPSFLKEGPTLVPWSGLLLGTLPGLALEEPQEALSQAKVSLVSLTRTHGRRSQEAPSGCATPREGHCQVVQVPGSEGPWDTLASSSLAQG